MYIDDTLCITNAKKKNIIRSRGVKEYQNIYKQHGLITCVYDALSLDFIVHLSKIQLVKQACSFLSNFATSVWNYCLLLRDDTFCWCCSYTLHVWANYVICLLINHYKQVYLSPDCNLIQPLPVYAIIVLIGTLESS